MAKGDKTVDLSAYLGKEPTDLQERMAEWCINTVGYDPTGAKNKLEAFNEGIRLGVALRIVFQQSPENQEVRGQAKSAREEQAETKVTKKANKKTSAKKAAETEPDNDDEDEEEAPAKPAKKAAKKAPAKPAKKAAKKAAPADDDDDEGDEF